MNIGDIEVFLRSLLRGKHSSLTISFNDANGPNYQTVAEMEAEIDTLPKDYKRHHYDWISEEERQKAIADNSMWTAQWYPDTPVSFYAVAASSLNALIDYLRAGR